MSRRDLLQATGFKCQQDCPEGIAAKNSVEVTILPAGSNARWRL
jgi:hypothetical protein